ncbi:superoxide dismutase family protein [Lysobacter sp. A3-1-A15]|uniref:superoxide dismutase family protein n=1 Tax=Novilysobacter viscosus TaxID=3098602 RepID=UPI002EDA27BD
MKTALLAAACTVAMAGCAAVPSTSSRVSPPPAPAVSTAKSARVVLTPASGSLVSGTLNLVPTAYGVRIAGEVGGLTAGGTHAIHIHERGDCSAADASSAGGHFNPAGHPHGRVGVATHHGGDMDNIAANGQGVAQARVEARGVTLGGGAANDVGGRAVVVHARADDYSSQPSGNAGDRVACGIIDITG